MKRAVVLVIALIASLALVSVSADASHSKRGEATVKVDTKLSLGFAPDRFSGKVRTSRIKVRTRRVSGKVARREVKKQVKRTAKKLCIRSRRVTVRESGGAVFGRAKTSRRGNFSVSGVPPSGSYSATAGKKKAKKTVRAKIRVRGKKQRLRVSVKAKITCKQGTSSSVVIEEQAVEQVYWGNLGIEGAGPNQGIARANADNTGGAENFLTDVGVQGIAIDRAAEMLYWGNTYTDTVHRAGLDGTGTTTLDRTGTTLGSIHGLAVDPPNGRVYWANRFADKISFTNMDGSGGGGDLDTTPVLPSDPSGVAIDTEGGRIFWADVGSGSIKYANVAGGGGGTLSTAPVAPVGPTDVAIAPGGTKIYWTDLGSIPQGMGVANLDGSGGSLVDTGAAPINNPAGIAIDPATNWLYWANAASIGFARQDGTGGTLNTAGATSNGPTFPAVGPRG